MIRRLQWLLLSCVAVLLFALPAAAGRLLFWRFESNQNRLVFTTDARVQPRAQLIFNPSRIVIDLPGIILGRPGVTQAVGGTIRSVRVGQFDSQTARIVIELAPGYTVDPQQVKIRGISPTQWTVELPPPVPDTSQPTPNPPGGQPSSSGKPTSTLPPVEQTQSADFQVTRNGLYVGLSRNGDPGQIQVTRSRDRRSIEFTLPGALLPANLRSQSLSVNNYNVGQIQFEQDSTSPPTARLVMEVSQDSPDWQATYTRLGGLILLPRGGLDRLTDNSTPPGRGSAPFSNPSNSSASWGAKATITAIELSNHQNQLLIRGDRSLSATGNWNRLSGYYEIRILNAQLANSFQGPQLRRDSPIYQLRIRQEDPQTVTILLRPSMGTQ